MKRNREKQAPMEWGCGHFLDGDAANQLGAPGVLVELAEAVIVLNRERRRPLANFRYFENG